MPKAPAEGKRKRAKKDPNAPKRPLGMYMMFCKERRGGIAAANPSLSVAQIGKLLGEEWRAMDEKEKERFRGLADQDKVRYEKEMETYNA
eukprot:CAMPEP_0117663142 /NCGR_PEP_ID=MMETSP0804-20121206/8434_1 /TAXON_ID=1074897 /ORGANISM="Tetraselmis astigmatica, Strain CCMP880" /LENGTH=89 /DNA_ID=CAMNT_0005470099 /DNA_START=160 /DNA_END=429 /DNA_ORIENTATION=+